MLFFDGLLAFSVEVDETDRFISAAFLCVVADCSEVVSLGVFCSEVMWCVAIESGGGEVSSGKVVLHIECLKRRSLV